MASTKSLVASTPMNLVITGGSSGIGKFLADSLAAKGHAICRLARSPQDGFSFQCDVSNWPALEKCAEKITAKWKAVDAFAAPEFKNPLVRRWKWIRSPGIQILQ
jgi:NAD(P)-dependent dehydrogenase (short-subunit alcohol dehydrogenase family)